MNNTTKRNIYLSILPLDEAREQIYINLPLNMLHSVHIRTEEALGKVVSQAIFAQASSPTFHSSAMDGVVVKADHTYTAREGSPKILHRDKEFLYINTGNPIPEGYNAVIMIENIHVLDDDSISIEHPAYPWQHIRRIGEDIVASELIVPKHHRITPTDIGLLLTAGVWELPIYEDIRVHILPTGDEILPISAQTLPKKGEVLESNSHVLKALLQPYTSAVTIATPIRDTPETIQNALEQSITEGYHIVLLCAGSSAGSKDFSKTSIEHVGKILFHGIQAMPGKPSMVGIASQTVIVGVPGYPASAMICFEKIIVPILDHIRYLPTEERQMLTGTLLADIPSRLGMEEFIRVRIGNVNGRYIAIALPKMAGSTSTLAKAQGIVTIPRNREGITADEPIQIELLLPKKTIDNTILCIGSHDQSLDILDSVLSTSSPYSLTTLHTGSMGGIQALQNNATHCAGMHLFCPITQEFTVPYLKQYLPERPFTLCTLAMRQQGLLVQKGNPKQITSIHDIVRKDITFINRQRGSGTRILFDYLLEKNSLSSTDIIGYTVEEFSHLAVALNVSIGVADCALGLYSAAKALDIDFIPIIEEQYDIVFPEEFIDLPACTSLIECIQSTAYKTILCTLGGYNTEKTGSLRTM